MLKFHRTNLNNVTLHYAEMPGPGPALVILHGITGSHAEFLHVAPKLAGQVHLYVLDLRGHGLSGRAGTAYQTPDYAGDVAAFLQKIVGDRRPSVLLGHSLGSVVAVWLAGALPQLVQGLILVDLPIYLLAPERFRRSAFYPYMAGLAQYLAHHHATGASLAQMVAYVGRSQADGETLVVDVAGPESIHERACQLQQVDPAVLAPLLAGTLLAGHEADELLAQVRCPVHLLAAEAELGGAMEARDIARAVGQMPHCTHTLIKGAGHDIHLAQPDAFVREVKGFLRALGGDSSGLCR